MNAARKGDLHHCQKMGPHMGANLKIIEGSPNVFIAGHPAARVGDKVSCRMSLTENLTITNGSAAVFFNGKAAARVGDRIQDNCTISEGASNILIGDKGCLITIGDHVLVTIDAQCKVYFNAIL